MPLVPRANVMRWGLRKPQLASALRSSLAAWPGTATGRASTEPDLGAECLTPANPSPGLARVAAPRRVYGAAGGLEVRLASTRAEILAAQRLRYQVFFEELSATPSVMATMRRRDEDAFDPVCDHLLVVDKTLPDGGAIVGTYRMLRQDVADRHAGFYSQGEYDLQPLLVAQRGLRFLELGRSCVARSHRTTRTVELLWHGLWTYIREQKADVVIGCASFPGIDPDRHALALSYLHLHALSPPEWRVQAHGDRWVAMDRMARVEIDARAALRAMPPLIKGYLRLGATFGDGAVIDRQFGTTDVFVVLPVARIDPRYFARFGAPGDATCRIGAAPASA